MWLDDSSEMRELIENGSCLSMELRWVIGLDVDILWLVVRRAIRMIVFIT